MTNDGDVNACTTMTYTEVKASILPARQPNLGVFTEDQRDLINRVIDDFADATTGDIMHAAEHELSYRLQRPYSQLALYPSTTDESNQHPLLQTLQRAGRQGIVLAHAGALAEAPSWPPTSVPTERATPTPLLIAPSTDRNLDCRQPYRVLEAQVTPQANSVINLQEPTMIDTNAPPSRGSTSRIVQVGSVSYEIGSVPSSSVKARHPF